MIRIISNRQAQNIRSLVLACRKQSQKTLVVDTIVLLCRIQLLTELCYMGAQLYKGTTYSHIRIINIEIKGLRKVGQG